jgi:uncharacterized protein (DUF2225 family)
MEGIYTKLVTCPVCKQPVQVPRLRHGSYVVVSRDTDLHTWTNGINPIYYLGVVCPNCGYAALESQFTDTSAEELKKLVPFLAKKRVSGIRSLEIDRNWDDALYILTSVFEQYEVRGADFYTLGHVAHNIAWLYREQHDEESELVWLKKALDYYLKAFEGSERLPDALGETGLEYLIADLYARLGNYNEALQWASRVVQMPKDRKKPLFDQLSRELWQELRDKRKSSVREEQNWRTVVRMQAQQLLQSKGLITTTLDTLVRNFGLWSLLESLSVMKDIGKEDILSISSFEWLRKLHEIGAGHKVEGDEGVKEILGEGSEEPTVFIMPRHDVDGNAIIVTDNLEYYNKAEVIWSGYGFLKGAVRKLYILEVLK